MSRKTDLLILFSVIAVVLALAGEDFIAIVIGLCVVTAIILDEATRSY